MALKTVQNIRKICVTQSPSRMVYLTTYYNAKIKFCKYIQQFFLNLYIIYKCILENTSGLSLMLTVFTASLDVKQHQKNNN